MISLARIAFLVFVLAICGCSTMSGWKNSALAEGETVTYDGREAFLDGDRRRDLIVVASFSGGGSRAAALAHAVVSELDKVELAGARGPSTLAREIDMLTGVSGGSVAAAHLASHGVEHHIERFGSEFLDVDFQRELTLGALSPAGLYRLGSRQWGRGHHLAKALDDRLFQGRTFKDLQELSGSPYLIVGATDVATGAEFDFASDQMVGICSNIDDVPLAFAVAASSAVPLIFSPMTLANHSQECAGRSARAVRSSLDPARDALVLRERDGFADARKRYIHLVDGGLSDNLGLRRIADYVPQAGGIANVVEQLVGPPEAGEPLTVVFIAIDAERREALPIEASPDVPSALDVLDAMVYGGLGRYSRETSLVFQESVRQWKEELAASRGGDVDVILIELRMSDLEDEALRTRAFNIPTAFRISRANRKIVEDAASRLILRSEALHRLKERLSPRSVQSDGVLEESSEHSSRRHGLIAPLEKPHLRRSGDASRSGCKSELAHYSGRRSRYWRSTAFRDMSHSKLP